MGVVEKAVAVKAVVENTVAYSRHFERGRERFGGRGGVRGDYTINV